MGQGEARRATMTRHDGSHNETVLLGATSGAVWGEACVTGWTLRHPTPSIPLPRLAKGAPRKVSEECLHGLQVSKLVRQGDEFCPGCIEVQGKVPLRGNQSSQHI